MVLHTYVHDYVYIDVCIYVCKKVKKEKIMYSKSIITNVQSLFTMLPYAMQYIYI